MQGSKQAVLRELEERLKAKCLRVVHWYSEGKTTGIIVIIIVSWCNIHSFTCI